MQDYQHPGVCLLYARLPASRCVPALARGREARALGGCKAFQEQVWKLWHEWLNTLLLNLPAPCSTGRTHRLHDGELSPSNAPVPVGNPNPHVPALVAGACPATGACSFPAGAGRGCWGGGEGKSASHRMFVGMAGPSYGLLGPTNHPGFGGCPCVPQSIPSSTVLCGTCSFRRLPSSLLPCCPFGCSSCKS